jgi:hypothetical protein
MWSKSILARARARQKIVPVEFLKKYKPDVTIVMNPYIGERALGPSETITISESSFGRK